VVGGYWFETAEVARRPPWLRVTESRLISRHLVSGTRATRIRASTARVNKHGPVFALRLNMDLKRRVQRMRVLVVGFCAVALVPGDTFALALSRVQSQQVQTSASGDQAARILGRLNSIRSWRRLRCIQTRLLAQTLRHPRIRWELMQLAAMAREKSRD
jgi:hypothetical protein